MLRDYARPDEPDKIKDYILDKISTGDLIPVAYNKDKEKIYIYEPFDSELWEYEFKPKEWGWDRRFWSTAKCKLPNVHYTDPLRASMVPRDLSYFLLRWVERPSSTAGSVALTVMSRTTSGQYITVDNIGLTDIFTEQDLKSQLRPITNLDIKNGKITPLGILAKQDPVDIDGEALSELNKSLWQIEKKTGIDPGYYFIRPNGDLVLNAPALGTPWDSTNIVPGTSAIGKLAFTRAGANKTNLQSIVLPESVREVGEGAFLKYESLVSIELNEGLERIALNAFRKCTNLTNITLPSSLKILEKGAFEKCTSLKTIVIPNGITEIPEDCFSNCTSLESVIIPDSVTTIEHGAFSGCKKLSNLILPSNLTTIGYCAFSNCEGLTSIVLPDSVTTVDDWAFSSCINLANIKLSKNLTKIGKAIFSKCPGAIGLKRIAPDEVESDEK